MDQPEDLTDSWPVITPNFVRESTTDPAYLLSLKIEYLTWPDRAKELDRMFWKDANQRLSHEEITAVINRQALTAEGALAVDAYARQVKQVLTEAFVQLDEPQMVGTVWQAFTWLLLDRERERLPAQAWLRAADPLALRDHLAMLPGYAFLILAAMPSDSVETFLARDAFWDAMLGATREISSESDHTAD